MSSNPKESYPEYENKTKGDGSLNPKYVDLLEEDKPLAGQKFTCISFVSPENILKQKNVFFFDEFIKNWEFSKSMDKFVIFLNFLSFKYKLTFDDVTEDFKEFVKEQHTELKIASFRTNTRHSLTKMRRTWTPNLILNLTFKLRLVV